ncbi:MAG TPA: 1-acyl-sn-glycerol-3-phosphate acyltransferase [Actinomycetota bacterium]|nr:1-acyl-sn-glycerol-3-phosphate acyltransferase [Actinomycetota bacterium]
MIPLPPRIVRRVVVAPLVFLLSLAIVAVSPIALLAAFVADVLLREGWQVKGGWQAVRLVALGVVFAGLEAWVLLKLFLLWVASGFGAGLRSQAFQSAHYLLARVWLAGIAGAAVRLLQLRIEVEDRPEPRAGPVLVFCRHAGPGDSILLAHTLLSGFHRRPRIVMKAALQWDPAIDVVANRLPCAFIRPHSEDPQQHLHAIERLARGLGDRDALVLFPEGGNFTERRRLAAIAGLKRKGFEEEADLAEKMLTVLAPRLGGALTAIQPPRMPTSCSWPTRGWSS